MSVVRKVGRFLWAFLQYLWKKFMKLSWKGKAITVVIVVGMGNMESAVSLAMIFITLVIILYMIRSLIQNVKL